MSNAIRFPSVKTASGLDAAAARRQFRLSLGVALAVLIVAAMIGMQPSRAAPDAAGAHRAQVVAPEFVATPGAHARLRLAMAADADRSVD